MRYGFFKFSSKRDGNVQFGRIRGLFEISENNFDRLYRVSRDETPPLDRPLTLTRSIGAALPRPRRRSLCRPLTLIRSFGVRRCAASPAICSFGVQRCAASSGSQACRSLWGVRTRRSTSDLGSWSSKPTSSRTSAGMPTTASTRPVGARRRTSGRGARSRRRAARRRGCRRRRRRGPSPSARSAFGAALPRPGRRPRLAAGRPHEALEPRLAAGRPHEALDVGPRVVELEADVEPHVDEARRQAPAAPRCLAAGRTVVRQGHGHDAARRDEHHVVEGVDDRHARLVQDADDQLAATVDQRINYRSHRQRRMMYLFSFVKPLTYTYTCCTRTCTYLWPPTLALVRITSYSS